MQPARQCRTVAVNAKTILRLNQLGYARSQHRLSEMGNRYRFDSHKSKRFLQCEFAERLGDYSKVRMAPASSNPKSFGPFIKAFEGGNRGVRNLYRRKKGQLAWGQDVTCWAW